MSYTNIEETRPVRSEDFSFVSNEINLLWKQREFRASLYEVEKKRPGVEPVVVRREIESVVGRRSTLREDYDPSGRVTHHFHDSKVHELRRSGSEIASTSSLTSDTTASVYEHFLFRYKELPQTVSSQQVILIEAPGVLNMWSNWNRLILAIISEMVSRRGNSITSTIRAYSFSSSHFYFSDTGEGDRGIFEYI